MPSVARPFTSTRPMIWRAALDVEYTRSTNADGCTPVMPSAGATSKRRKTPGIDTFWQRRVGDERDDARRNLGAGEDALKLGELPHFARRDVEPNLLLVLGHDAARFVEHPPARRRECRGSRSVAGSPARARRSR